MEFTESLLTAMKGLASHKMRTFLTMLGVIFGVAAVIAMVSIGAGAKQEAVRQIELMGLNSIRIRPKELHGEELRKAKRKSPDGLTLEDMASLGAICPLIEGAAPLKELDEEIHFMGRSPESNVIGTDPVYPAVTGFEVVRGRFLEPTDLLHYKRVCVIGADIKRTLFAFDDPLQARIQIGREWFTVVGMMKDKHMSAGRANVISIRDLNKDVYIPVTTMTQRFMPDPEKEQKGLTEIAVRVTESDRIREAANIIDNILSRRHNGVRDYELMIPEELLRQSQKTQRIFNIVMSAIAGISLLVGGIGIMNIMLASVTQRTREIGIRRAIGATQNDILGQFLIECLTISLMGGIVGIFVGVAMGKLITVYAKWETIISLGSVILSFGVAGGTGVIFGIYPAMKAAKLDPIEALRYQ